MTGSPFRGMDPWLERHLGDVNDAYTRGGYDIIDYNTALEPPLSNDDAAWTGELLRSAGRV